MLEGCVFSGSAPSEAVASLPACPSWSQGDHCSLSRCTHRHQDWRRGKGRPILIAGEVSKKRLSQKLSSNASMSRWPRLNHLASLTSVVETIPEKKPRKRLTVGSWQRPPPFSPVSFLRNLQRSPFGSPPPLQRLACPACQPGPPQSSVPWHAGALCLPRSLLLLKGPLALPSSTPGASGLLSQSRILSSMHSQDVPVNTAAVCCSLPGPGLRASG